MTVSSPSGFYHYLGSTPSDGVALQVSVAAAQAALAAAGTAAADALAAATAAAASVGTVSAAAATAISTVNSVAASTTTAINALNATGTASKDAAATSATAAAGSAATAAGSVSTAAASATAAAGSVTAAGNSATAAATSATNAATSATNAGNSATNAATSATAAAGSVTTAAGHVTSASGYATAASGSATTAATSATNAGTSATNAATSATNAAASATAAQVANFRNRLINSGFLINQRAVTSGGAISAAAYGLDRWKAGASGGTMTFGSATAPSRVVTITAGTFTQVVDPISVQAGTYVLSWTGTAQGRINGASYGASPRTVTLAAGAACTVEFNTGTLSEPQLERASVASSWEYRPASVELALAQRFFEVGVTRVGYAAYTTGCAGVFPISLVAKRAIPTMAQSSSSLANVSSLTVDPQDINGATLTLLNTAAGNCSGYSAWSASAEL